MDHEKFAISWGTSVSGADGTRFKCGHCGADAGVIRALHGGVVYRKGGHGAGGFAEILFCPVCSQPSYKDPEGKYFPAAPLGADLKNLPKGIDALYREARLASGVGAYTACVMACRKILMNLAVLEKAKENQSFVAYVDYLVTNGFVPPKGREWVSKIRDKGNEATHEIKEMSKDEAADIVKLVEMLLRFNFELVTPVTQQAAAPAAQ